MGIAPDSILGMAVNTVTENLDRINQLANTYNAQLSAALTAIGQVQVADTSAPSRPAVPQARTPAADLGELPAYDALALKTPALPEAIDIEVLLSDLDVGAMDDLPPAPTSIAISIPDAPAMASIPPPARPEVDTDIAAAGCARHSTADPGGAGATDYP